jgi:hypothetical protein
VDKDLYVAGEETPKSCRSELGFITWYRVFNDADGEICKHSTDGELDPLFRGELD